MILPTADKVFEYLLCGQLRSLTKKVYDPFNSAYRKLLVYSCETTLVRLVEDWKRALDNGQTVGVLSFDMSKAFHSMVPVLLLSKLQGYGFSYSALAILKSYFTNRKNRVRLGNVFCEWKPVLHGCPHGSSLGPILWTFYHNDTFYENTQSQLSAYADDHQLYFSDQKISKVVNQLEGVQEEDGNKIAKWYKANYLSGNLFKYQAMVMTRAKQESATEVYIDNHAVQITRDIKLLGVILDENLDFSAAELR